MIYLIIFLLVLCIVEKLIPKNTNLNFFIRICMFIYIVFLVMFLLGIVDFGGVNVEQVNINNFFSPFKMKL